MRVRGLEYLEKKCYAKRYFNMWTFTWKVIVIIAKILKAGNIKN